MTRILIVDDSAFLRGILKRHLSQRRAGNPSAGGCVLSEAASKADALRKFRDEHPDLVLLDIVMDQGTRDGVEILAEIMRSSAPPKVIMMTAVGQDQIMRECMELGACGYVLKPFDEQQVLAAVESALAPRLETATADSGADRRS